VLTDDLGSVRTAITNQAGTATVAGYMGYGPFGFVQYHAGQTGTNKGYTGQDTDPLSGLDYYVARYYDPVVGLFLSADTVQSNLQGFDPYAYVGNNPETLTDPTGHCDFWCSVVTGAVNLVDASMPPAGFAADAWEFATEVHNGWQATPDQLAAAKLTGTLWGLIAVPGIIAGVAGTFCSPPCLFLAASAFIGQAAIATYVAPFANDINQAGANFYAQHPINPPETQPTPATSPLHFNYPPPIYPRHRPPFPYPPPIFPPNRRQPTSSTPPGSNTGTRPTFGQSAPTASGSPPNGNWTYYTVTSGDTLWGIATMFYGLGLQWQRIYQANIGVIGSNPNLIYAGERLRILR
jgi:RHS repeat-associated protein